VVLVEDRRREVLAMDKPTFRIQSRADRVAWRIV